jgi:hypothetical protein
MTVAGETAEAVCGLAARPSCSTMHHQSDVRIWVPDHMIVVISRSIQVGLIYG